MTRFRTVVVCLVVMLAVLNVVAFGMLESRSRRLAVREAAADNAVAHLVDDAIPIGGWQRNAPPVNVDIVALYVDDFADGIVDATTPLGRWTAQGTFEHTYIDHGRHIVYVVASRAPDAWMFAPTTTLRRSVAKK